MEEYFYEGLIDRNSAVPIYHQLKIYIKSLIDENTIHEGDMLPPEDELAGLVNISRPTVRQAFKELALEGYIERKRAKGTFVTKPHVYGNYLSKLESFYSELVGQGKSPVTKVITLKSINNDEKLQSILKCDKSIYLERVRFADGKPVVYIESYLPYKYYHQILNMNMENQSMYEKMKELHRSVSTVKRIVQATGALSSEAKYLEVEKNTPLLYVETTGCDVRKEIVEYSVARYKGNSSKFQIELSV